MWQSWVEIMHYSVAYLIALLRSKHSSAELLFGAHMHCVNVVSIREFTQHI